MSHSDVLWDAVIRLEKKVEIIDATLNSILRTMSRLETLEASLTEKKSQDDSLEL
jgi:hypothetical protein